MFSSCKKQKMQRKPGMTCFIHSWVWRQIRWMHNFVALKLREIWSNCTNIKTGMKLRPQSPFIYTYTYRHIYTYTYRHIYRYTYKHIVYVHIYQGAKSIVFFCLCVCVHVHFRWGTHLYMLLFLSVCLFVCCTLYLRNCALYHYMIIISGAHILNDSISRLFFHFIKNFNFLGP